MKKIIIVIFIILIVFLALFVGWYNEKLNEKRLISNYNAEYEQYISETISGVDLTTVINKALDNNETYSIEKDENEHYINDNMYYTCVYAKLSEDTDSYSMESFYKARNRGVYRTFWRIKI